MARLGTKDGEVLAKSQVSHLQEWTGLDCDDEIKARLGWNRRSGSDKTTGPRRVKLSDPFTPPPNPRQAPRLRPPTSLVTVRSDTSSANDRDEALAA